MVDNEEKPTVNITMQGYVNACSYYLGKQKVDFEGLSAPYIKELARKNGFNDFDKWQSNLASEAILNGWNIIGNKGKEI